jgi:hypothetical protein
VGASVPFTVPEPNEIAQRPSIWITSLFWSFNFPLKLPVTGLKTRISPLPNWPTNSLWLADPKSLGANANPQGALNQSPHSKRISKNPSGENTSTKPRPGPLTNLVLFVLILFRERDVQVTADILHIEGSKSCRQEWVYKRARIKPNLFKVRVVNFYLSVFGQSKPNTGMRTQTRRPKAFRAKMRKFFMGGSGFLNRSERAGPPTPHMEKAYQHDPDLTIRFL